jgi:hypothetical protein
MKVVAFWICLGAMLCGEAFAQGNSTPHVPCAGDDYGNSSVRIAIEQSMVRGTSGTVSDAINAAKSLRGVALGCPSQAYPYLPPSYLPIEIAEVVKLWQTIHAPTIATFRFNCPSVGREWATVALGACYARLSGATLDTTVLRNIVRMYEAQQYRIENVGDKEKMMFTPGVYGYPRFIRMDSCSTVSVVVEGTDAACKRFPDVCVQYKSNLYPGQTFLVSDVKPDEGWIDGGLAFDHAWIGALMIEAAFVHPDPSFRDYAKRSALLAGSWAVTEPPVRNHNYTAKLVWLLAQLYDWTGEKRFREAMVDKLERNLLLGVLMDEDRDGYVDGTHPKIAFTQLTNPAAQRPGRMWDGHNALPGYHAMNAWALVEAYCALRDRDGGLADSVGLALRAKVKRTAVAMLDNLAWEINHLGVGNAQAPGFSQLPFALLTGLWKLASFDREPHPAWDSASTALWNIGYAKSFGANTVNVGLYMAYRTGQRYTPLSRRTVVTGVTVRPQSIGLEQNNPNPFSEHTTIRFKIAIPGNITLKIFDALGRAVQVLLKNEPFPAGEHYVNFSASGLQTGMYMYRLEAGDLYDLRTMQIIKLH